MMNNHEDSGRKRAEEALRESEEKYRELIENSLDVIYSVDAETEEFRYLSPSFERMLGYTAEDIRRMGGRIEFLKETIGDEFTPMQSRFSRMKAGEEIPSGTSESWWISKSGERRYILDNWRAVFKDGKLLYTNGILRDITERRRAEEELLYERMLLETLLDNTRDTVYFKDTEARFICMSKSLADLFSVTREEAIGKTDFDFFKKDLAAEKFADDMEVIRSGIPVLDKEEMASTTTDKNRWVSTSKFPWYGEDSRVIGLFGMSRDISERKRAEQEINKLNAELEQRAIERMAQLEASNKELEAFSYSVSHDLRSPLRAIDGFSRILIEEYNSILDEEGKRLLTVVRSNTKRMGQLIDDLLAFSRMGWKEMTHGEINMESLARSVFEDLKPTGGERTVEVAISQLPPAVGDEAMIRQVFVNLLSNAFKFTRNTARAVVQIEGRIDGGECVYSVRDNGVGFDMEYKNKLFGIFQRLHGQDEFEGTGIGLAIVQRIIHRHGGRVWGEGKVNGGACFSFALPVKSEDESGSRERKE